MPQERELRYIDTIVVHCSASSYGNAELFDKWHREKGWQGIGYHYVITNCYPTEESLLDRKPDFMSDGMLETGREIKYQGAHVKGFNAYTIGICLVGRNTFTSRQLLCLKSQVEFLRKFLKRELNVVCHYELDPGKTCPNINGDWLRKFLEG